MGQSSSRASQGVQEQPQERRRDRRSTFFPRPASTIFEDLLRPNIQTSSFATTSSQTQLPSPPLYTSSTTPRSGRTSTYSSRARLFRSRTSFTNSLPSIFRSHGSSPSVQQIQNRPNPPVDRESERGAPDPRETTPFVEEAPEAAELDTFDTTFRELSERSPIASRASSPSTPRRRHISPGGTERSPLRGVDRGLRNRSAPLRRRRVETTNDGGGMSEDNTAILTRLLSITAAATAASLLGNNPDRAISRFRDAGGLGEDDDGAFDEFLRELSAGRIASALNPNQRGLTTAEGDNAPRAPRSLNFFRMFRIGSSNATRRAAEEETQNADSSGSANEQSQRHDNQGNTEDSTEHRMIPILIVGIRSLNGPTIAARDHRDSMSSIFEAFGELPTPINMSLGENVDVNESTSRPSTSNSRAQNRRRASMGGINMFSREREPTRNGTRPLSDVRDPAFSDTPPGSFPPPTTPASPPLSALSSRTLTPIHSNRASIAGLPSLLNARHDSAGPHASSIRDGSTDEAPRPSRAPRHRRLSESDFNRFGSGAARRNGVHLEPDAATTEGNRSWVIYVLGGNYPENHPILSTPSLFTDSPSYEDMILLSTLLGPVKPPVASAEDVANAPGVLRIGALDEQFNIIATDGTNIITIPAEERCQVCLTEYQIEEEARQLVKCGHVFHRECIDQWLTTGNNTCPLCRSKGVEERAEGVASSDQPPTIAPASTVAE